MNTILITLEPFFYWLVKASFQASVIICLIFAIKVAFGRKLTAHWHYLLWLLVVARLVMPSVPQSSFSIYNLIPERSQQNIAAETNTTKTTPATIENTARPIVSPASEADRPQTAQPAPLTTTANTETARPIPDKSITPSITVNNEPKPNTAPIAEPVETPTPAATDNMASSSMNIVELLPFIWLCGLSLLAIYVFFGNFRLWRIIRVQRPVTDSRILDLLEDCKSQMNMHAYLAVVETDQITSPALFGFLRPRLLLPKGIIDKLTAGQLRHIFLHELAHLKRGDIYFGWLTALLQTMHWFNPMVWLAFHKMRADRELACDQLALAAMKTGENSEYGKTIVSLLEEFSAPQYTPGLAGILEDRSQLKRRIAMIASNRKGSIRLSVAAAVIMLVIGAVALTDAQTEITKPIITISANSYEITLDNETKVELLGLCQYPADDNAVWWKPDGNSLTNSPFDKTGNYVYPNENEKGYVFAFKYSDIAPAFSCDVSIAQSVASTGGNLYSDTEKDGKTLSVYKDNRLDSTITHYSVTMPNSIQTCDLDINYADGNWKTETTSSAKGSQAESRSIGGIIFGKPVEQNGKTVLSVTDNLDKNIFETRIIAKDLNNNIINISSTESYSDTGLTMTTVYFNSGLDKIKSFEFQTRQYKKVRIEKVSLVPQNANTVVQPKQNIVETNSNKPSDTIIVYVMGKVRHPGPYNMEPNSTLKRIIGSVGGSYGINPDEAIAKIERQKEDGSKEEIIISLADLFKNTDNDYNLENNDLIIIASNSGSEIKPSDIFGTNESQTGKLEFRIAAESSLLTELGNMVFDIKIDGWQWMPVINDSVNTDGKIYVSKNEKKYLLVSNKPDKTMLADGSWGLVDALEASDNFGNPAINVKFDDLGSEQLLALTGGNINKPLAICVDGEVYSVPNIMSKVSDRAIITGNFTKEQATELANKLKTSMPAKIPQAPIKITGELPYDAYTIVDIDKNAIVNVPQSLKTREECLNYAKVNCTLGLMYENHGEKSQIGFINALEVDKYTEDINGIKAMSFISKNTPQDITVTASSGQRYKITITKATENNCYIQYYKIAQRPDIETKLYVTTQKNIDANLTINDYLGTWDLTTALFISDIPYAAIENNTIRLYKPENPSPTESNLIYGKMETTEFPFHYENGELIYKIGTHSTSLFIQDGILQSNDKASILRYKKVTDKQQSTSNTTGPDLATAEKMVAPLKGMFSSVYDALEDNNPDTALKLLEAAMPQVALFKAKIKGTDLEVPIGMAIEQLHNAVKALKDGDINTAKAIISGLNQAGPELEEMIIKASAGKEAGQGTEEAPGQNIITPARQGTPDSQTDNTALNYFLGTWNLIEVKGWNPSEVKGLTLTIKPDNTVTFAFETGTEKGSAELNYQINNDILTLISQGISGEIYLKNNLLVMYEDGQKLTLKKQTGDMAQQNEAVKYIDTKPTLIAMPGTEENAAKLIQAVWDNENFIQNVSSFYLSAEKNWLPKTQGELTKIRKDIIKYNPDKEINQENFPELNPDGSQSSIEIAFAANRIKHSSVSSSATGFSSTTVWTGREYKNHQKQNGKDEYFLNKNASSHFEDIFMSLLWFRNQNHVFWWVKKPDNNEFGKPSDYIITGIEQYRSRECYVIEYQKTDDIWAKQLYIGKDDGLLYGLINLNKNNISSELWYDDFREICPNCFFPMTQSSRSYKWENIDKFSHYENQNTIVVKDIKVNEPLPDSLFDIPMEDGVDVYDSRFGHKITFKYKQDRTEQELSELIKMQDEEYLLTVYRNYSIDQLIEVLLTIEQEIGENKPKYAVASYLLATKYKEKAVEPLVAELLQTDHPQTQSLIAFTLRAINSNNAVNGLIEALGNCGFCSDYGLGKSLNAQGHFLDFYWRNNQINGLDTEDWNLGRPVREITIALEKITGHSEGHEHFNAYDKNGNRLGSYTVTTEIRNRQMEHRRSVAGKWKQWWNENKAAYQTENNTD